MQVAFSMPSKLNEKLRKARHALILKYVKFVNSHKVSSRGQVPNKKHVPHPNGNEVSSTERVCSENEQRRFAYTSIPN